LGWAVSGVNGAAWISVLLVKPHHPYWNNNPAPLLPCWLTCPLVPVAGLKPDEVPAILQRGKRVLSRRETAAYGRSSAPNVNITIQTRDAESFRQSRTQVSADIARAVAMGRRGM